MKRLFLIGALALFYLAACSNSDTHSHDGESHSHDDAGHTHEDDGHDHSHGDDHDHAHPHEQEEFTVNSDTLQQDSLKNHK